MLRLTLALTEMSARQIQTSKARRNLPSGRGRVTGNPEVTHAKSNGGHPIVERVRAGMRRAKLEGRRIGRAPLDIDRQQIVRDRRSGLSLRQVAKKYGISRAS